MKCLCKIYSISAGLQPSLPRRKISQKQRRHCALIRCSTGANFMDWSDHQVDEYKQLCAETARVINEGLMKPGPQADKIDVVDIMQDVGDEMGLRVEYSRDRIIVVPRAAGIAHQEAESSLKDTIGEEKGWKLLNGVQLLLPCGTRRIPDISGWRRPVTFDRFASQTTLCPDWVCEILSTKTKKQDLPGGDKYLEYEASQILHYWIVDPLNGQIDVYKLIGNEYAKIQQASIADITECVLEPFKITCDLKQVFEYMLST